MRNLLPLSLYIHLPWCERKCPYCDFNSHETTALPEQAYVDTLISDLCNEGRLDRRPLQSIFFGGGTPSLFSADAIASILKAVRSHFELARDCEITMEANPGSSEQERFASYVEAGVTRFSLGIQSFEDHCLKRLGRIHDCREAISAIDAAKVSGAQSFNIDLMHGLPEQDATMGLGDVNTAISHQPPHISWYQLTIERNTPFYRQPPVLPMESVLVDIETAGSKSLMNAGFRRYEISAWAQPGQECRHNINYWQFGDYIGVGAGAHGKQTTEQGEVNRYAKTRVPKDYMSSDGQRRCATRALTAADRSGEFMLGALRLIDGVDMQLFEDRTGLSRAVIAGTTAGLKAENLLVDDDHRIQASELGLRYLDDVVGRFFTDEIK